MKLGPADLEPLDDASKLALLEALVTGVLADGRVTPGELERFDEIVTGLPWGMDRSVIETLTKGTVKRVAAMQSAEETRDFISKIAERIPSSTLREKVFYTMATIIAADGDVNQLERNVIGAFALAFNITTDRLAAVKAALAGQPAPTPRSQGN